MSTNWTAEAGYALAPMKIEAVDHQVDLPRCNPLPLGGLVQPRTTTLLSKVSQAKVEWLSDRN